MILLHSWSPRLIVRGHNAGVCLLIKEVHSNVIAFKFDSSQYFDKRVTPQTLWRDSGGGKATAPK